MKLILAILMTLTGTVVFFGSATKSEAGNYYRSSGVRHVQTYRSSGVRHVQTYRRPVVVRNYHRPVYRTYRAVAYRPVHRSHYRPTYTRFGRSYYSPHCR
jgi:hypothetical protein